MLKQLITPLITAATCTALAVTAHAEDKKTVKVYIMAGQSNMVGIGQVGPIGATRFNTYVSADKGADKGATVSIYEGAYDPSNDYDKATAIETHHVQLGYWPHTQFPTIEGEQTQIARGFIRIDRPGIYSFKSGDLMAIGDKVVYKKEAGEGERIKLEAGTHPITVTFFGGGKSNLTHMVWDTPGTLSTAVKEQGKFPYLLGEDGEWKARDDVYYKGYVTATADQWLQPGCGASKIQIGPELGFGHVVGDHHDEPVLLIKASQGNRSLGWDFLPPGSERFEHDGMVYAGYKDPKPKWEKGTEPESGVWYAGKQYDDCFNPVKKALATFNESFPQFAGHDYEIAGFVWWQGHKDGGSPYAERYEQNLVHLINTLRQEFNVPNAPFVIGTVGFGGWDMEGPHVTVAEAQLAVDGNTGKYPEFKGNVKTMETRDLWIPKEQSPRNQDFHYNQNAETYMNVGLLLGKGMLELVPGE